VATAAETFGQQDDITVLSICRTAPSTLDEDAAHHMASTAASGHLNPA
jgi:hypothetical protein